MSLRSAAFTAVTVVALGSAAPPQSSTHLTQNVTVKEDRPGLLARAGIRPDAALRTALARVPGGRVREAEIEVERGRLVYSFELEVSGTKALREVTVDAATGAVVAVEDEREDDDEDPDDDTDDDTDEKGTRPRGATKAPAAPVRRGRS